MRIASLAQGQSINERTVATRFAIEDSTAATAAAGFGHVRSAVAIIETAVGIAQLAEHRTVAPTVAGSIPVSHPKFK